MSSRLKVFGLIALLGAIGAIIVQVIATYGIPWLAEVLPSLSFLTSFVISGIVGAVLAVTLVGVWAYMTGKKDRY